MKEQRPACLFQYCMSRNSSVSTQILVEWIQDNKLFSHTYEESWLLYLLFPSGLWCWTKWTIVAFNFALSRLKQQHLRLLLSLSIRALRNVVAPCSFSAYVKGQVCWFSGGSTGRLITDSSLLGWPKADRPWASMSRGMCTALLNLHFTSFCRQSSFLLEVFFKDYRWCEKKILT